MTASIKWRGLLVLLCLAVSFMALAPSFMKESLPEWWTGTFSEINLGLDLQGGMHLVLGVDVDKAVESRIDGIVDQVESLLRDKDVIFRQMKEEFDFIDDIDRPAFLGEFGFFRENDISLQQEGVDMELTFAEERGIHWALWAYKDTNRMGLLQPKPESDWRKFVERDDFKTAEDKSAESWSAHFNRHMDVFKRTDEENMEFFFGAHAAGKLGWNRAALFNQMKELAKYPEDVIVKMPEAFRFSECMIMQDALSVLKKHLP